MGLRRPVDSCRFSTCRLYRVVGNDLSIGAGGDEEASRNTDQSIQYPRGEGLQRKGRIGYCPMSKELDDSHDQIVTVLHSNPY